ncbi:cytidylyltransferase domain-containing protein [Polaribacter sp. IC073]|uniref:acylneuraminate cytidylyltransferase family protein n=1 Tax=Polaribacter sp. IC073 TaxID=2508540 RepID=UPI0011BD4909|nr:acylneuraminate cytidylyltransferase family protein [Polaribacter sp. IC073]TXD49124.1 acylneuraminate cytidylyltransferase family protein [Polaribacter sp. IC073]
MKILGIIPARGGSKGVPRKNIKLLDGEPLIAYSIKAAQESRLLTDVFVSTDSEEIIAVAKKYNCSFFKRSEENAGDNTPIEPVIYELLDALKEVYDLIVLLQPTAPIREGKDIDNVINMFIEDKELESVVSVVELEDIHPARMYNVDSDKNMESLESTKERFRRQDLTPVYLRNGSIYATKVKSLQANKKLISSNKKAYIMPENKWANIDTERDFLIAEVLVREWKNRKQ